MMAGLITAFRAPAARPGPPCGGIMPHGILTAAERAAIVDLVAVLVRGAGYWIVALPGENAARRAHRLAQVGVSLDMLEEQTERLRGQGEDTLADRIEIDASGVFASYARQTGVQTDVRTGAVP